MKIKKSVDINVESYELENDKPLPLWKKYKY